MSEWFSFFFFFVLVCATKEKTELSRMSIKISFEKITPICLSEYKCWDVCLCIWKGREKKQAKESEVQMLRWLKRELVKNS